MNEKHCASGMKHGDTQEPFLGVAIKIVRHSYQKLFWNLIESFSISTNSLGWHQLLNLLC